MCLLVSCIVGVICELVSVLQVMSSVEVLPIMHMFVHSTIVLDSFDKPPNLHDLGDSRNPVASSQGVLTDFRSQMLDRIRLRPDSAHFDARRLSTNLQPSLCSSLVLDMLFLHLRVVCLVVDVFWH